MLVIGDYSVDSTVFEILQILQKSLTNGKLGVVRDKGSDIVVTCPFHADGREKRPSCYVRKEDGVFHCFTDGEHGGLEKFISGALDCTLSEAKTWILNNFDVTQSKPRHKLSNIELPKPKVKPILNEEILNTFDPYHPYMTQRRISDKVIKEFEIKYDPKFRSIVFPVRDKFGKLRYLTRRSVDSKNFYIDEDSTKEVYLLYDILKNKPNEVYITESQINTLVCRSYGKSAIGLFGANCTDEQINDINNTSVVSFVLALDPDPAGLKGIYNLCKKLSKDKFISVLVLPEGKDIGDLTEAEFNSCPILDKQDFLNKIPTYYKFTSKR